MPLYEYECTTCHRRTEKIQKFSDPELTTCPFCQGPLERTLTAPAIQFKGSGWYKDLYSSAKPPSSKGDEGAAAPAGDSKGGGKEAGGASGSGGSAGAPGSSGGGEGAASTKSDSTPATPKSTPAATASAPSGGSTS